MKTKNGNKKPFSILEFNKRLIEKGGTPYKQKNSYYRLFSTYNFTDVEKATDWKVRRDNIIRRNKKAYNVYKNMGGKCNLSGFKAQFRKYKDVGEIVWRENNQKNYKKRYDENIDKLNIKYDYFRQLLINGFSLEQIINGTYKRIVEKKKKKEKKEAKLTERDKKRIGELLEWGLDISQIVNNYGIGTDYLIKKWLEKEKTKC